MEKETWEELLEWFEHDRHYDDDDYFTSVMAAIDDYYGYDEIFYCEAGGHYELTCFLANSDYYEICEECLENI